ncbi:unnamed protein product [Camellia sinensis]
METRRGYSVLCFVALFSFWASANALLSPKGVNFEVQALMADKLVIGLGTPSQNLLASLSPSIGHLTNLQIMLLQNNNTSGPIPTKLGRLPKLQTLNLSNNFFAGEILSSLAHLKSLQYLRLNNNSLSGSIPFSLANMTQLAFLDLSYNNLNGPVPRFLAKTFNLMGNPMICATGTEKDCNGTTAMPLSYPLNNAQRSQPLGRPKGHKFALAFGSSLGCICLLAFGFGFLLWWRQKHYRQIFFDVNELLHEQVCLGNLKRFQFRELQSATKNFSSKSIIGNGGFGNVYKGYLQDGTVVAVKRLKDGNAVGGEIQFQTEVKMISLAAHRNLLRLYGFCKTLSERLLVYPYMSNGSVASRLKGAARAMLDWEKKLDTLVGKDLKNNYDRIELKEMVQVALLCTQYLPSRRPKMSEVVRTLEGDGLAEKWEASQRANTTRCRANEFSSSERYSDLTDDSSLLVQAMELSGPR